MAAFVTVDSAQAPPGIGKIVSISGTLATVQYFNSPIDEPEIITVPLSLVREVGIPTQTRAYWFDEALKAWRVGRIIDGDGNRIEVRFPNGDERSIPSADLHIRWDKPILDPAPFLAQFVCETPLFADARSAFARSLMAQREASLGMSSLLSSGIELEAHQIDVVRRVLQDPVQRYLLADEVGLGKTIEAGILIRQYTLDEPDDHRVVILVPPSLVVQWTEELRRRFYLRPNAGNEKIRIVSTDETELIRQILPKAGMVVIDEAHHLSGKRPLYELVQKIAAQVPRLLLLSATPVLRNEQGFLEMLHLLDPDVYRLDDGEAFAHRIASRQALAETVAALIPENVLQLGRFLDDISQKFADDPLLIERIGALRRIAATFPEEDDLELLAALSEVRSHLSEIYRLDRRILRNRRSTLSVLTPERAGLSVVPYRSEARSRLVEALDHWRTLAANSVYGREDGDDAARLADWYADFVDRMLSEDWSVCRILLASPPLGLPLDDIGVALELVANDDARWEALWTALEQVDRKVKCVVFCSCEAVADRVSAFLQARLGDGAARAAGEDREESITSFLEAADCRVLVCDRSDEEGLNLQGGAKAVIHFDLPLSPNRIEQRIGRLDRYGSGKPVLSLVLVCDDDPYQLAWTACLDSGLDVFRRSVASLQYLIEAHVQLLRKSLLSEGHEAIGATGARLGGENGEVGNEMRRIDHQDALDALLRTQERDLDRLEEVESEWLIFQKTVDDWLVTCLKMSLAEGPRVGALMPGEHVCRYALQRTGRHPTLIPLSRFVGTMLGALDPEAPGAHFGRPLTHAYAARRRTALSRKSVASGVRILRYGDVLLDGLQAITALEDRGRCFAVWRGQADYKPESTADVFLRFDFVAEADIEKAVGVFVSGYAGAHKTAARALQRRGDMLFPPFYHRIWLDEYLQPVTDVRLLSMLEASYAPRGEAGYQDVNLNPRRVRTLAGKGLAVVREWPTHVMRGRKAAEEILRKVPEICSRAANAVARARSEDAGRFARLRMRIARDDGALAEEDRLRLAVEEPVAEAIYAGILEPKLTLDTIGAVFLSNAAFAPATIVSALAEDD
ncbi:protein DpdE [Bradyrhizobium elkanii]|uniref:protein DpdE n=1 Tax=Bradyrhizobium elkanii TaxID=29448 RepID=UPI002714980F|nr:protein DpdE [Bradyrhizobium elkanii]WLB09477.1 protein DpdE [Bradyrhizobium elkanii]WLB72577.1 protein DpdE [Bradyrhizobium elkanii]